MTLKKGISLKIFTCLAYIRYLLIRYIVFKAYRSIKLGEGVEITNVSESISFFGYYNITPVNGSGEILHLKVNNELKRGSLEATAEIMLNKSGISTSIAFTRSWNWQQGCMLQWLGELILFNDYDPATDSYRAKIINREGNIIKQYELPVSNLSKCGRFAVTLNYDRLTKTRPTYGYFNRKNQTLPSDQNDGIWYLNLTTGESDLIVTLEQLKKLSYSETMNGAIHKVNHLDINPEGTRLMFLHRWNGPSGRFMRLITCNLDGSDLHILNGDNMISHCCWLNDTEILSYCEYHRKRGYFRFIDKTDNVNLLSQELPFEDGHPSVSPDGKWIITDTYPGKSRISRLYLHDLVHDQTYELGRFFQPLKYTGECRIDLHPKWGKDINTIFIESGHLGKRQLFKLDISQYLERIFRENK